MRRHEQTLKQQTVLPHCAAAFTADAGRGQLVGCVFDEISAAGDIAARGGKTAAGVFDERTGDDICADLRGLDFLGEFSVAVIDHNGSARVDLTHNLADLADLLDGKRLAHGVAAAALNEYELNVFVPCRHTDRRQIGNAVLQVDLLIADAVALHAAAVIAGNGILKGVVRRSGNGQNGVPGLYCGEHCAGQGMRAVDKADAHESSFCAENIGIDFIERIAAVVIVAIAGRAGKQIVGNAVLCEGGKHLFGIPVTDLLNTGKIRTNFTFGFGAERTDFLGNF